MRQVIKIKNFVFDEVDEADFTKRKIKKIKRIAAIQGLGNSRIAPSFEPRPL